MSEMAAFLGIKIATSVVIIAEITADTKNKWYIVFYFLYLLIASSISNKVILLKSLTGQSFFISNISS